MKTEFKIFLAALMFYTRFPVKQIEGWSEEMLNKSTRYFTLTGIIVGGVGASIYLAAVHIFPISIAVILSMVATIFFTGAFHEDGFADFCDGFGGGYTKERILEIMKDSRIGTYGTIGLLMILGTKFLALTQIEVARIPIILIAGHAVSRMFPVLLIYTSEYVRLDATSKTKPIGNADSTYSLLLGLALGGATLFLLNWLEAVIVIVVLLVVFLIFRSYVNRKSGGYTGDVLGALQQLCEVFFYLTIVGIQNY